MIYMSVFSWISTILSIACVVWLFGLAIFVIVKSILHKVKSKKQMKQDLEDYEKSKKRKFGMKKD